MLCQNIDVVRITRLHHDPKFYLRPGASDHVLLERVLRRDLFSEPIDVDGLIIDAPHAESFRNVRQKLPITSRFLIDPQVYRLQSSSFAEHLALMGLPYSPGEAEITPAVFESPGFKSRFVKSVLDYQVEANVTTLVAPAFYVESPNSPWIKVNERLLKESIKQAGHEIFASLCGSYGTLCKPPEDTDVLKAITSNQVAGILLLVSPFAAANDSPAKLVQYLELLNALNPLGAEVISCRQPAFGLSYMALNLASFDSGIGITEQFDYASLVRPKSRASTSDTTEKQSGGRKVKVYLRQLMTSVSSKVAADILSTSGVAGSFVCNEACCRDSVKGSLLKSREHFLYSRTTEVRELKNRLIGWRREHVSQSLISARQLSEKVLTAFPDTPVRTFRHLDIWLRVLTEAPERRN